MSPAVHKRVVRVVLGAAAPAIAAAVLVGPAPPPANAAEVTRVVSAFDDENRYDLNVTLAWFHEARSALIKRESAELAGGLYNDLKYAQTRDLLDLRVDLGLLRDVGLQIDAPLVLGDTRQLELDDGSANTILRDAILPSSTDGGSYGIDAEHGGRAFRAPDSKVFRGPRRRGFQDLGVGINWAFFNQARDDTKPTWLLGFEARLDLFKDMRFDPADPTGNTAVGLGYHQLIWKTSLSKRMRRFEPYFVAWYMLPIRTNGGIFQPSPEGSENQGAINPQQRAAVMFGFEQTMWQNRRGDQRVVFELRGRMEEHFFGRSASELWEPLSGHPGCSLDADAAAADRCRAGIDVATRKDANGVPVDVAAPHPGVTETQAYGTFGGDAGLSVLVGRYVRFRGLFGLTFDMPHFITFATAGVDRNGDGVATTTDASEANPTYRESIDLPGRRFKVEGTRVWSLLFEGSILF